MTFSPINFYISPRRRLLRNILIFFGIVFFGIGIWYTQSKNTQQHVLWVFDNSLSMSVSDIQDTQAQTFLSRLDAAKILAQNIIQSQQASHAIFSFSRLATLQSPFSQDIPFLKNVVQNITALRSGGGNDLAGAWKEIATIYATTPNLKIIVVSDGEFFEKPTLSRLFATNTEILFVCVGTKSGGPMLLEYASDGSPRYRQYHGETIFSLANPDMLTQLSQQVHGASFWVREQSDIQKAQEVIQQLLTTQKSEYTFPFLFFFGSFCIMVSLLGISPYHIKKISLPPE